MARKSSVASKVTADQLTAREGELQRRWAALGTMFNVLAGSDQIRLNQEFVESAYWVGIVGGPSEVVQREFGQDRVVPVHKFTEDVFAWVGFREVWDQIGQARNFAFRSIGITLYLGRQGESAKPQVLRSEWPGVRDWRGLGPDFQTPNAAMPHWQVDVLRQLAEDRRREVPAFAAEDEVVDFSAEEVRADATGMLERLTLERMHLASSAPWWEKRVPPALEAHVNAPITLEGLNNWTIGCIKYLHQELGRCVLR